MKSAYELAMERLQKQEPSRALSATQKAELSELESLFKSKIAELEITLGDEIQAAESAGDYAKVDELRLRLASEKTRLEEQREDRKERVRRG